MWGLYLEKIFEFWVQKRFYWDRYHAVHQFATEVYRNSIDVIRILIRYRGSGIWSYHNFLATTSDFVASFVKKSLSEALVFAFSESFLNDLLKEYCVLCTFEHFIFTFFHGFLTSAQLFQGVNTRICYCGLHFTNCIHQWVIFLTES